MTIHASRGSGLAGTLCGSVSKSPTSSTYANCRQCARILISHGGVRDPKGGWYYPDGWIEPALVGVDEEERAKAQKALERKTKSKTSKTKRKAK